MRPSDQLKEWEWIEAYHRGTLPPDDRLLFEQELASDFDFRQTSEQLLLADKALQALGLEHTVKRAIQQELATSRAQPRLRLKRVVSVLLASAILCIGYLTFSRVDLQAYRNDVSLTQRYRDPGDDAQLAELTPRQRQFYRDFFDAQVYLANGQPDLSISNLEKLAQADSLRPYFRQAIQWHLVNAYLLSNQPDNAETTFQLLNQVNNPVYPISQVDRWKVWWQIRWQQLRR